MTQDSLTATEIQAGLVIESDGVCTVCEQTVHFRAERDDFLAPRWHGRWLRSALRCPVCDSVPRQRAFAKVLTEYRPNWRDLSIHESSPGSSGFSKRLKSECRSYTPTQFDQSIEFGTIHPILKHRSENLEAQTFESETFDLVVCQDVFEHIMDPRAAIREIERTLKPGGMLVMTVPFVQGALPSRRRAERRNGDLVHLLPEEYHGSPVGSRRSLVTIDWGMDIGSWLTRWSNLAVSVLLIDDMAAGIRDSVNAVVIGVRAPERPEEFGFR